MYQEISAMQLEQILQKNPNIELIDVREQNEWDMIRIPQAKLIPISQFPDRYQEIDFDREVYVLCRTGARSGQACAWLAQNGKQATNVAGSIKSLYETRSKILEITEHFQPQYLL